MAKVAYIINSGICSYQWVLVYLEENKKDTNAQHGVCFEFGS